jgi:hypothetical protein
MPRRRRSTPDLPVQPETPKPLPEAPAPATAPAEIPVLLEYQPGSSTGAWRVERFDALAAEFNFADPLHPVPQHAESLADRMRWFHDLISMYARQWLIVRRLFGVAPVIPSAASVPDDLRVWSRAELCENLGLANDELQAELDAVRAVWDGQRRQDAEPETAPSDLPAARTELDFGDNVLAEFDFSEDIFEAEEWDRAANENKGGYKTRKQDSNRSERAWFLKRVKEWRKILSEPMASALARNALLNELHLRRLNFDMARFSPSTPRFKELSGAKQALEETYQSQLQQLDEICPWSAAVGGKLSFRGVVSEMVDAWFAWKANGQRALIDRIYTAAEIEIMIRASAQMPEPRYRLGQNLFIIEAMHGLHDPNYASQLKPRTLKLMDETFKRTITTIREERGEALVDLEKDGDEFPPLVEPVTT